MNKILKMKIKSSGKNRVSYQDKFLRITTGRKWWAGLLLHPVRENKICQHQLIVQIVACVVRRLLRGMEDIVGKHFKIDAGMLFYTQSPYIEFRPINLGR